MGASVGMMRMWGNNKTAKYLMPLLSKEKKKMAMETVQEKAKEAGIEVPAILTDIDEKSGLPKIFEIVEVSLPFTHREFSPRRRPTRKCPRHCRSSCRS